MVKKILIRTWSNGAEDAEGNDIEENTLQMLNALVSRTPPQQLPTGIEQFRVMNRIAKAFDSVEDDTLVLDDEDYVFLKKIVEKQIPAIWAMNTNISEAVEDFLNPSD